MLFEQLNPHSCKTYLIANDDNSAVIIDPVIEHFKFYIELLKERKLKLTHVIDTHTHADHISAGSALRDATGCEYVMHENAPSKCVSIRVEDGDVLNISGMEFKFLYTPGHTKDAVSIIVGDKLLTGDFLFLDDGGAGRDDLPGGDPADHWESLKKLDELPDELVVYPAHEYRGRQPSNLGTQRKTNPHLQKRSKDEFIRYIEDLRLGPAEWMKDVLKANYACSQDPNAAWIPLDIAACEIKGTMEEGVNETEVDYISAHELNERIREGLQDTLLVDVREEDELEGPFGHIEGIHNIPIGELAMKQRELQSFKNSNIVTVCRSGARATTGAQILKKAGFEKVFVLEGGMKAWREHGF
ncbi:rhodanese-like sulfurtransferase (plasmid) [Peptoclostridium acidaminophilum DSM 3953]|uniref:Rhodanese-like sulfurtransferase n=1 Tax=Peptoclostridium acidaminophilum DSM 3953 TaxID=1286171 RepID=W8T897_PEPAC|nr:MBL fold metallo-hydrolase [Peptoclostridium acidaminophilum]AHM57934.1 rhodanese-like sulfurtransferase [Peptoclostridium acidaminophilum DSM 3953]